jgi:hypothetical protein
MTASNERLSGAGVLRRPKTIYPDHRPNPWLTDDATPQSLEPIVRPVLIGMKVTTLHKISTQYGHQSVAHSHRDRE